MNTPQPECPECEKLSTAAEKSNTIGEFLDYFLSSKGIVLARWEINDDDEWNGYAPEILIPAHEYRNDAGINKLLAEYFGINMDKVEKERMALLEWLRNKDKE